MPLNLDHPYSLYSIPVVYATAFYPHFMKFSLIDKTIGFHNQLPRENNIAKLEKKGVPQHIIDRCTKLGGAHANGNETYPLWAAAVLAANYAGVEDRTLNLASGTFVALRLLYNYLYINARSESVSWLRSASFFTGLGIPIYLLIKAANKLGSRA